MVQLEYRIANSHVSSNSIQQKLAVYPLHVKNCVKHWEYNDECGPCTLIQRILDKDGIRFI